MYRSIQKLQEEQEKKQKYYYREIISEIKKTIEEAVRNGKKKCYYQVPVVSFGQALNNIDEVMAVLKTLLKKEHIKMIHIKAFLIHLNWEKVEKRRGADLNYLFKRYS